MKTATFFNFTEKPFEYWWDGKKKVFPAGIKVDLEYTIAAHFAKHLANKILMEKGGIFETYTSPSKPDDVPAFKELFDKACIPAPESDDSIIDAQIASAKRAQQSQNEPSMDIHVKPTQPIGQPAATVPKAQDEEYSPVEFSPEDDEMEGEQTQHAEEGDQRPMA